MMGVTPERELQQWKRFDHLGLANRYIGIISFKMDQFKKSVARNF